MQKIEDKIETGKGEVWEDNDGEDVEDGKDNANNAIVTWFIVVISEDKVLKSELDFTGHDGEIEGLRNDGCVEAGSNITDESGKKLMSESWQKLHTNNPVGHSEILKRISLLLNLYPFR